MIVEASTTLMMISGGCAVIRITPMEKLICAGVELAPMRGAAHVQRIDIPTPVVPTWPVVHGWQTCANHDGGVADAYRQNE